MSKNKGKNSGKPKGPGKAKPGWTYEGAGGMKPDKGNGGGGGGNGGGGGGNGGGGGKGEGGRSALNEEWMKLATAQAQAAHAGEQQAILAEQGRADAHVGDLNSAFDLYQQRAAAIQGAQAAGYQGAVDDSQQRALALSALTGAQGQADASGAQQTASVLGQDGGVAQQALSGAVGSQRAQAAQVGAQQALTSSLGLADTSDIGRRRVTAEGQRISATQAAEDYRQQQAEELAALKAEIGQEAKGAYTDIRQFEKQQRLASRTERHQNKLAIKNLKLSKKELIEKLADADADRRLAYMQLKTENSNEDADRAAQIAMNEADNATSTKNAHISDDGNGGGNSGSGSTKGLTDSEAKEYHETVQKVQSVLAAYRQAIKNGKSPTQAAKQARGKAGQDQWMAQIARQMVSHGKLTGVAKKTLQAHLPGKRIPKSLR